MLRTIVLVSCCAAAAAQSTVVPPDLATVEGNGIDREPFGYEGIRHITYTHRDVLGRLPAFASIGRIAYRRDTGLRTSVLRRPPAIWQVRMGNYRGSVLEPPSAWPAYSDPDWRLVFQPRQISFPDLSLPAAGPAAFDLAFWLDQPFVYQGSHLGVEHFVADNSVSRHDYFIDAVHGLVPGGSVTMLPFATGCPPGRNRATGQAPNPGAGDLELYLFGGEPNLRVAVALGASNLVWGGLPLPLDLAAVGLPGCRVHCSIDVALAATTTPGGLAELRLPVPGSRALAGATLYAQWLCAGDARVNPALPLAVSDGLQVTLGSYPNASFVGSSVVSAFSGSNQFGIVQPNRGPVFELAW